MARESSEDCIRRSDAGLTGFEIVMCNGDYREALRILLEKIAKAPSVIPQPKTAHWTKDFICSDCGCKCYPMDIDFGDYNYCPNCGKIMKEVSD